MAHITTSVEYGIHCLLWLVDSGDKPLSSRDLAELQGISVSFVAKIFPRLEKAGIVSACEGVRGGYQLARRPEEISFLQIVDEHNARLRVFERGAGETLACGTGACAAVVAGILRELLVSPVSVETRGGRLSIAWNGVGTPVLMTGPAVAVFTGEATLP